MCAGTSNADCVTLRTCTGGAARRRLELQLMSALGLAGRLSSVHGAILFCQTLEWPSILFEVQPSVLESNPVALSIVLYS